MEHKEGGIQNKSPEYANVVVLIISAVSLIIGAVLWLVLIGQMPNPNYVFRPLSLLSLFALVINLGLMAILYKRIQLNEAGFWFLAFLGTLAAWCFTEFMQRISGTQELAEAWRLPAIFSWATMSIMYLFFVLSYIDKQHLIRRLHFQVGVFLVVTSVIYAQFRTDLVLSKDYILRPWGYDSDNGPYLTLFGVWLSTLFICALYLFFREYLQTVSQTRRKQILIFISGLSVLVIVGVFTDIILPAFGHNVLPMAPFLTSVQGAIIGYGIYKHGMFSINPVILSGEIMKTLPQPVIVTDQRFDIQFMNSNASQMFRQYQPFLGKGIKDIFGNENFINVKQAISSLVPGHVVDVERIPLGLDGQVVIAQAKISSIPGGSGYIFGLSNITQQVLSMRVIEREVKNRTQLYNQERARLLASVNGLRQGFLILDDKGKISLINKQAQSMFEDIKVSDVESGHVVDGSESRGLDSYFGKLNFSEEVNGVIRNSSYANFEEVEFKDRILDIEILPILIEGSAIGAVILLDDVTDRTLVERSKDEFFSIASHELRTPLTAIRGNTSMIISYYGDEFKDPDLKEMINDIHGSSVRLIEIVNDFLDTSRLEQDRMEFNLQNIRLSEVIGPVVKDTAMVAKEKNNIIKVDAAIDTMPLVHTDVDKLKQVFYNLVGNSIKFTENGTINIFAEKQQKDIKISIKDQGRGIPEESQKLLFRKFQQASNSLLTRDTTKGTGLGLYISKMLVEKMGGSIALESSSPGQGSTFCFTVPLAIENHQAMLSEKE